MFDQAAILADLIHRERALAASPTRLERRRLVAMAEALRCCTSSLATRVRGVFDRQATACCATG